MIRLPLWAYVALAAFVCLAFAGIQTHRLKSTKAEYAAFVADVKAKGEEQERRTKEKTLTDQKLKESTDAQNAKLRGANAALAVSLRESRARGGILSAPSPGSSRPDLACFNRAELERAFQLFDAGASQLISEGDSARIDLDTARDWVKNR